MAYNINTTPVTILESTSTGPGEWYRVHPNRGKLTFQIIQTGTSVGATVASTVLVQASNDGVNPLLTTAGSTVDALATVVLNGGSPQSAGFAIDAAWEWVRINVNSLSTGTIKAIVGSQAVGK